MAWIKIRNDIEDDPAVISIAAQTKLETDHVVGKLRRLWAWADEQTYDGNGVGVTEAWIDARVGVTGFARAMVAVRWLVVSPGGIVIPNFERHNGETAKQRAVTAKRVSRHRGSKSPESNGATVTLRAPEKIREEKNIGGKPPITPQRVKTTSILPGGFTAFWNAYPRSRAIDRAKALQAWARHGCEELAAPVIIPHVEAWKASGRWDDDQYCPHAVTYINQRRWESPPPSKGNSNGTTRGNSKQDADQRRAAQRAQQYDEHLELPPNLLARPNETP